MRCEDGRGQHRERPDEHLVANPDGWVPHEKEQRGNDPEAQDQTEQEREDGRGSEYRSGDSEAEPDRPSWYGVLTLREIAVDNMVLRPALLAMFLGMVLNALFRVSWQWAVPATVATFAFQSYHGSRYVREERARLATYRAWLAGHDDAANAAAP